MLMSVLDPKLQALIGWDCAEKKKARSDSSVWHGFLTWVWPRNSAIVMDVPSIPDHEVGKVWMQELGETEKIRMQQTTENI